MQLILGHFIEGGTGVAVAAAILFYLSRARVRATFVGTRGHGCRQRPIYLEDARSIAEPLECAPLSTGQSIAHEMQDLSRRDVEQDGTRRGQIGEAANRRARLDASTEFSKI